MPSYNNLKEIFLVFFKLGIQSFGGGSSTLYLVHQACLTHGWLNDEEFVRAWALVQISPGINLVKLIALIGYQLCGWLGLVASMLGLLLPSATITILMTAGYSAIRTQPLVQAAMRGILPATIGLSLAMTFQLAQSIFTNAYHEGKTRLGVHALLFLGAFLLTAWAKISPLIVMFLTGALAIAAFALVPARNKPFEPAGKP